MFKSLSKRLQFAMVSTSIAVLGCAPPAAPPQQQATDTHDHDHEHHHADTFAGAVTELTGLRDKIRDAFAAKNPDDAHHELHEVAHVLEGIPTLAQKAGLDEAGVAAVKVQINKLFELYTKVDDTMHGQNTTPAYEGGAEIDAAIEALSALVK